MLQPRKKLIEVALPLDAINKASVREKSIRYGHPSTLHLWWARRPLAAARAVIFSQMVDDPSEYVDVLLSDPKKKRAAARELKKRLEEHEAKQALTDADEIPEPAPTLEEVIAELERDRLFRIIEKLVVWENTKEEAVLAKARTEIWQSWQRACADNAGHPRAEELFDRNHLPDFHDPFAGGGALPLEAQWLGLDALASDLNPVAVLINKAMIEIPPKFDRQPPVNPKSRTNKALIGREWQGAQGLAEDVRHYGKWMSDQAGKRIGQLYPQVDVTAEMVQVRPDLAQYQGRKLKVIAWLWARTVKSPNPAFAEVEVPLVSTFMLSAKKGKEAYIEPVIENGDYRFTVKVGVPKDVEQAISGTSDDKRSGFFCLMSGTPLPYSYIRSEGIAGRMGQRLMGIVAEGDCGRVYLGPTAEGEASALNVTPEQVAETELPEKALGFRVQEYGMTQWRDLFTPRQLVALTTFSDLVGEAMTRIREDARTAGLSADDRPLRAGGRGATAYAEAVGVYLAFAVDKCSDYWSGICSWHSPRETMGHTSGHQAIPMVWDYAEAYPMSASSVNWIAMVDWVWKALALSPASGRGTARQADAHTQLLSADRLVSTDPPYYDNIGYADLSDFFYVWLRRSLRGVFPELFDTLTVPKAEELIAAPDRHGGKKEAEAFFLNGMTQAMHRLAELAHPAFPVTIYYAFKQAETKADSGTASTGWETFLDAVISAGFGISGTWPIRTEKEGHVISNDTNALASSIVLVCRKRADDAPTATRREFIAILKNELLAALTHLQHGNIAPVDLAQAAIGPGMAVYTRYAQVLDAEGNDLSVREALALINEILDEALAEQEGDFDADSRWALTWFEQHGFAEGKYGDAEQLSKAKNISLEGLEARILYSKGGKVRLLKPEELSEDWDPASAPRLTVWEMVHHLIRALETDGEQAAAELVASLGAKAEAARELCYRLYTLCERKNRTAEALAYNGLVQSWPEITRLAR